MTQPFTEEKLPQIPVKINKIVEETPRVKSFYFKIPFQAEPGQFINVEIPDFGERPFGAVIIDPETLMISVGAVGEATKKIHTMKEGDELKIRGPFGTFFTLPDLQDKDSVNLAMVAGGYGLAPISFLAKCAAELGFQVTIFVGARTANEIIEYPFLKNKGILFVRTTDDGSAGNKGFVTDAFSKAAETGLYTHAFIVGPLPMEEIAMDICKDNGIPFQVSMEKFAYDTFGPVVDEGVLDAEQ